jgi:hypothetical protein
MQGSGMNGLMAGGMNGGSDAKLSGWQFPDVLCQVWQAWQGGLEQPHESDNELARTGIG